MWRVPRRTGEPVAKFRMTWRVGTGQTGIDQHATDELTAPGPPSRDLVRHALTEVARCIRTRSAGAVQTHLASGLLSASATRHARAEQTGVPSAITWRGSDLVGTSVAVFRLTWRVVPARRHRSELFGHSRGPASTGFLTKMQGRSEQDRRSLFGPTCPPAGQGNGPLPPSRELDSCPSSAMSRPRLRGVRSHAT
jgi:hypothetical protein